MKVIEESVMSINFAKKNSDFHKKYSELEKRKEEYKKWFFDLKKKDEKNKLA
jgi:hypothetical protein